MNRYDLAFQRELLWLSSKPGVQRLSRLRLPTRALSGKVALVLGSQRSGTTLMFLMLTAHPRLTGLDEVHSDFDLPPWPVVAANALSRRLTVYKLPMVTARVDDVAGAFPRSHLIWMVRHPFAVVASMRDLMFPDGKNWLTKHGTMEAMRTLAVTSPEDCAGVERLDPISLGATIWKHKLLLMENYREQGMQVHPVKYEDLVTQPEAVMRPVIGSLGLEWSEHVLEHHRFHGDERHAGGTRATRPVDQSGVARGDKLTAAEKDLVANIAGDTMSAFGYAPG
ncbi:MAG: sulfotransferase [Thiohalocapsa sp.]|uniref:sulfotransferase family protein n=1 Tax=Thiohalocapsa sp. TaxID=2497641 RepID=UPI0025EDF5A9|nr:sulfotransferase [Thiohalocapsa sp.]MCG6942561.1 sulfotransferase [Thiohalocapsa sp.]